MDQPSSQYPDIDLSAPLSQPTLPYYGPEFDSRVESSRLDIDSDQVSVDLNELSDENGSDDSLGASSASSGFSKAENELLQEASQIRLQGPRGTNSDTDRDFSPSAAESLENVLRGSDDDLSSDSVPEGNDDNENGMQTMADLNPFRGRGRKRGRPRGSKASVRGLGDRRLGLNSLSSSQDINISSDIAGRGRGPFPTRNRAGGARGSRRGRGRGPRPPMEPSEEFKSLQGKATRAFYKGDYDTALEFAQESVQSNPEIFAAHSLLSEIFYRLGKVKESLEVIRYAAHTRREVDIWWEVANRFQNWTTSRTDDILKTLNLAYSRIIDADKKNVRARRLKIDVLVQMERAPLAARECEHLLKLRPNDLEILQIYAEQSMRMYTPSRAKVAYDKALEHYRAYQVDASDLGFAFSDLNVYVDLYAQQNRYGEAIVELKSLARWLVGREEEAFWENFGQNDCEWDYDDEPRRTSVPGFQPGLFDIAKYGQALPLELRAKMGIYRVKLGAEHLQEAMSHFYHFEPTDTSQSSLVHEYPDVFKDIANALFDEEYYAEALPFFEARSRVAKTTELIASKRIAICYFQTENLDQAIEFYKLVLLRDEHDVDSRTDLCRAYRRKGLNDLCDFHVQNIVQQGRKDLVMDAGLYKRENKWYAQKRTELKGRSKQVFPDGQHVDEPQSQGKRKPALSQSSAPQSPDQARETNKDDETPRWRKLQTFFRPIESKRPIEDVEEYTQHPTISFKRLKKRVKSPPTKQMEGRPKPEPPRSSTKRRVKQLKPIYDQLQEIESRTQTPPPSPEDEDEWVRLVSILTDEFVSQAIAFPNEKHIPNLGLSDLEPPQTANAELLALSAEHSSIPFSKWLDLFCQISLYYAQRRPDPPSCYAALKAIADANAPARNERIQQHIRHVELACAYALRDVERLTAVARWFAREYPFSPASYTLYEIVGRITASWPRRGRESPYSSNANQKFVVRHVKARDFQLLGPEQRARFPFTDSEARMFTALRTGWKVNNTPRRSGLKRTAGGDAAAGLEAPDPTLLVLHAHVLAANGPLPGAVNMLLRTYAVQKENTMMLLCLAVYLTQHAMRGKNQSDRHRLVLQGLAWFHKYRKVRLGEGEEGSKRVWAECEEKEKARRREEVEYNEGRLYHMLGLNDLAALGYGRCLEVERDERGVEAALDEGDDRHSGSEGFKRHAAYNLQQIFAMSGDVESARKVAERYLVF